MNDDFVYTLPDTVDLSDDQITASDAFELNETTITIDTSYWDDSFTTSHSAIYTTGNGNVSIEGELTVGGVDVMQSIKDLQRVLGVVSRDIEKEEKYAGLKRAAEAYERELAKIETFEAIKDSA